MTKLEEVLINEYGYSDDAAKQIQADHRDCDESSAKGLYETYNEYSTEQEMVEACSEDTALFDKEKGEFEEPTIEYVYQNYEVCKLDNGHYLLTIPSA